MSLDPLANPKGVKRLCELCQKPAYHQCLECRVTFYCCTEHQQADWVGIHKKTCQLLVPLRKEGPNLNSESDRRHRDEQLLQRQKQMIEITGTTGQRLLFEGKHEQAIPAAMQSLRFSILVHGVSAIELVPSYLILGEASTGLGRLSQAEEYLSQAQWTILKTPDCSNAIKSKFYRNLGLLYAAKEEYAEALHALADDVYHASTEFGTNDIRTSGGFFHMANVFMQQGKHDVAYSLYEQVCNMWYNYLHGVFKVRTMKPETPKGVGPSAQENKEEEEVLDEAQEAEAYQALNVINDVIEKQEEISDDFKAKIALAVAKLLFVLHDMERAKEFAKNSAAYIEKIKNEELAKEITDFIAVIS